MKFADMVREARNRGRVSQRQLGQQLGVWNTYVGQIEKGEKVPSDDMCARLAKELQLDTEELLLAAYQARAKTGEAKRLFEKMKQALKDPLIQRLLAARETLDPNLLEVLADADVRGMLTEKPWREMMARWYRLRRKRDIPGLLGLIESMSDRQWNAFIQMLEAMAQQNSG